MLGNIFGGWGAKSASRPHSPARRSTAFPEGSGGVDGGGGGGGGGGGLASQTLPDIGTHPTPNPTTAPAGGVATSSNGQTTRGSDAHLGAGGGGGGGDEESGGGLGSHTTSHFNTHTTPSTTTAAAGPVFTTSTGPRVLSYTPEDTFSNQSVTLNRPVCLCNYIHPPPFTHPPLP